jgi:hypothetical protein
MVHSCAYCGGGPVVSKGDTCSDVCAATLARWKALYARIKSSELFVIGERQEWSMRDDEPMYTLRGTMREWERFIAGDEGGDSNR